jgi:hypothetical protein
MTILLILLCFIGPFAAFVLGAHVYQSGLASRPVVHVPTTRARLDMPKVRE